MALVDQALVDLDEFKDYAKGVSGSLQDTKYERLINSASNRIEKALNGHWYRRDTATEDHSGANTPSRLGGARRLWLRHSPIVSVTSITDDDTSTIASGDYTIVSVPGYLEHDFYWPAPTGRWTVIYTAGDATAIEGVKDHAKVACCIETLALLRAKNPGALNVALSSRSGSKSMNREKPMNPAGLLSDEAYSLIEPDIKGMI